MRLTCGWRRLSLRKNPLRKTFRPDRGMAFARKNGDRSPARSAGKEINPTMVKLPADK